MAMSLRVYVCGSETIKPAEIESRNRFIVATGNNQ